MRNNRIMRSPRITACPFGIESGNENDLSAIFNYRVGRTGNLRCSCSGTIEVTYQPSQEAYCNADGMPR